MGIQVDFNPDLALRDYSEFEKGNFEEEECVPKDPQAGKVYNFLKKGQRVYWFNDNGHWSQGEMPLMITEGKEQLSRPIASIKMIEATHFLKNGEPYTKGKYKIIEVFNKNDSNIHFESYKRIKN